MIITHATIMRDESLAEFAPLRQFNGIRGIGTSGGNGLRLRLEQIEQATRQRPREHAKVWGLFRVR